MIEAKEFLPNGANDLENLSTTWDRKSTEVLVPYDEMSNFFGGFLTYAHLHIHGEDVDKQFNSVTVMGYIRYYYNIERGTNGPTSSVARYYTANEYPMPFDIEEPKPLYTVSMKELTSADVALANALNIPIDRKIIQ